MIRIYRKSDRFQDNSIIRDNESFFRNNISPQFFDKECENLMYSIDRAEIIDIKNGAIKTPYGITSIYSLSTGCKTAINVYYVFKNPNIYRELVAVDLTECGYNAIDTIFDLCEKYNINIKFTLEHCNDLYKCKDREYCIDDKEIIESLSLM